MLDLVGTQIASFLMDRLILNLCSFLSNSSCHLSFEPQPEKTGLWGFRPGSTQTGPYSHQKRLETRVLKSKNCTIRVTKIKALISCAVTAPLFFFFAQAKIWFSLD